MISSSEVKDMAEIAFNLTLKETGGTVKRIKVKNIYTHRKKLLVRMTNTYFVFKTYVSHQQVNCLTGLSQNLKRLSR